MGEKKLSLKILYYRYLKQKKILYYITGKAKEDRGYQVQEAGACPVTLGPIEADTLLVIWAQCTQESIASSVL